MRMICLLFLLMPMIADAANYVAAPGSTLGFEVDFQGDVVQGSFARFTPRLRFDPAHLESSRFDVTIDLASASTGVEDGDQLLRGPDVFAVAKAAQARFLATKVRALGGDRFVADGELTLRGLRRPVTLAFRWTNATRPVLEGEAGLRRRDFGITVGEFGSEVGERVRVRTRLLLAPAPKAAAARTAR